VPKPAAVFGLSCSFQFPTPPLRVSLIVV
jgi:hypothetical protein